jgi:DNA-binding XRE family transcriptional regulator
MRLAEVRRRHLLSTRELGQQANVARKTIMDVEAGRVTPTFATIRKLCAALGVEAMDVDEFRDAILGKELAPTMV